jgi:hypothetical protein
VPRDDRRERRRRVFLKKEAKTFAYGCPRRGSAAAKVPEVFWFFFSNQNMPSFAVRAA